MFTFSPSLNRTKLELKCTSPDKVKMFQETLNRTKLELKFKEHAESDYIGIYIPLLTLFAKLLNALSTTC